MSEKLHLFLQIKKAMPFAERDTKETQRINLIPEFGISSTSLLIGTWSRGGGVLFMRLLLLMSNIPNAITELDMLRRVAIIFCARG